MPYKSVRRQFPLTAAVRARRAAVLHARITAYIYPASGIYTDTYTQVRHVLAVDHIFRARITVIINAGTFNADETAVAVIVALLAIITQRRQVAVAVTAVPVIALSLAVVYRRNIAYKAIAREPASADII